MVGNLLSTLSVPKEASITALHRLARAAGLALQWRDADGRDQATSDRVIETVLSALGYGCSSERGIERSIARIDEASRSMPRLLVTDVGAPTPLPVNAMQAELRETDGSTRPLRVIDGMLAAVDEPGYYDMLIDGQDVRLAVAPPHCPLPTARAGRRLWGAAVQIPALRGSRPSPFGNLGELDAAVAELARKGADAVAINPVHAMFAGHGLGYSPYSPSSRQFLNAAMGDPALLGLPGLPENSGGELVDWETALPLRQAELRAIFERLTPVQRDRIRRDNAAEGEALRRHALYDAIDSHYRPKGRAGWQAWPKALHNPAGLQAEEFAQRHAGEVEFHLFAQWLVREGLAQVQGKARDAGMAIGLIADLAVGVDPGGSDCWAMPEAMLRGLTIGAPPDPLGPLGQNWSLTGFSPAGLRASGYAPWLAMLRSALSSAGGLRIDHAFGLARLWVIPDGEDSSQGAYLEYPFADLLRLATLEAHLAGAIIIAEDLGTSPHGFTQAIAERQMLGMRVLWFERAEDHGFVGSQDYPPLSVAMTGTHDTATVAGWWSGRDLDWAERLGRLPPDVSRAKAEEIRAWDRGLLWSTIGDGTPRPTPEEPTPVVEAALRHVARTPSCLAIAPLEDLLALEEQPNLPGTVAEHPNWRRRLGAPLDELLSQPDNAMRIAALSGQASAED